MWNPETWQQKPVLQAVTYPNDRELQQTLQQLAHMPPLVTDFEITSLRQELSKAETGAAFILQGGDCCEQFSDCTPNAVLNKFKILLQMSVVLIYGLKKPVIRVGRIAGQYAKPRSKPEETQAGLTLPAYRGDIINSPEFSTFGRTPAPKRMLDAYFHAAATLNYLRALVEGRFADLHHPEQWELDFVNTAQGVAGHYHEIVHAINQALNFFESIAGIQNEALRRINLYTSHEALHLPYEAALTRQAKDGRYYNLGTHFPWLGMRTLSIDGAHIEYLRGIANPIGIKVGPTADFAELIEIIKRLNPNKEHGKIMLIHRFGVWEIAKKLPVLLELIGREALPVVYSCDPMHGNTKTTQSGIKTRHFEDVLREVQQAFLLHRQLKVPLGGIHFEMTGENVTECLGGACGLTEADLSKAYKSLVDPRLNYAQALEMALLMIKD